MDRRSRTVCPSQIDCCRALSTSWRAALRSYLLSVPPCGSGAAGPGGVGCSRGRFCVGRGVIWPVGLGVEGWVSAEASHCPVLPLQVQAKMIPGLSEFLQLALVPGTVGIVLPSTAQVLQSLLPGHPCPRSSQSPSLKLFGAALAGGGSAGVAASASIMIWTRVLRYLGRIILVPFLWAPARASAAPPGSAVPRWVGWPVGRLRRFGVSVCND
jgi:hypothetical protein